MSDLKCPNCGGETQQVNGYDRCLDVECNWLRSRGPAAARAILDQAKARKDQQ